MIKAAGITACGKFRPWLLRQWASDGRHALWVMLNPSTADAEHDDPTLLSCIRISKHHGFGGLRVVNLYDWRATKVSDLKREGCPRSSEWWPAITSAIAATDTTIAAWGASAGPYHAAQMLTWLRMYRPVYRVALTKDGQPGHPLYLRADTPLVLHE